MREGMKYMSFHERYTLYQQDFGLLFLFAGFAVYNVKIFSPFFPIEELSEPR